MVIPGSTSEKVGELSTRVVAHDSPIISTVNIAVGHQETHKTGRQGRIEYHDGLLGENDARFRA